ncbi:hypothetical protein HD806DRAFT_527265 [Xylariaceae sp. AK1471]|nr:hypothetical protein HD806DRAFT_527265 [Xylariaceae sp. AK1471]
MVRVTPSLMHLPPCLILGQSPQPVIFSDRLILKVKLINEGGRPQEYETLAFLAKQQLSFKIPTEKEHISTRIAQICSELKAFQSSFMTLGMDCSAYVLSHNDLGSTNILINGDQIVIIDWDLAGYYPVAWVRTKFAVCRVLDMERISSTSVENDGAYRIQVEQKLGNMGFPELTEPYKRMCKTRMVKWVE